MKRIIALRLINDCKSDNIRLTFYIDFCDGGSQEENLIIKEIIESPKSQLITKNGRATMILIDILISNGNNLCKLESI